MPELKVHYEPDVLQGIGPVCGLRVYASPNMLVTGDPGSVTCAHCLKRIPEWFYAIHRTDGELIDDVHDWVRVAGPDDWEVAEDDAHTVDFTATEYEIARFTVTPVARRRISSAQRVLARENQPDG